MKKNYQTRTGVASFFMVSFATIVAGIIMTSFSALMLRTLMQSTNDSLSQRAYDAAMSGVEDAKVAISLYNDCLNETVRLRNERCEEIISAMSGEADISTCDMVSYMLNRNSGNTGEIEIRTEYNTGQETFGTDQYYTCAFIGNKVTDYTGEITNDNDFAVIPLRSETNSNYATPSKVKYIVIAWQGVDGRSIIPIWRSSEASVTEDSILDGTEPPYSRISNAPISSSRVVSHFTSIPMYPWDIKLGFVQSSIEGLSPNSFYSNNGTTASNRGSVVLDSYYDSWTRESTIRTIANNESGGLARSAAAYTSLNNLDSSSAGAVTTPVAVGCYSEYQCSVAIELPDAISPSGAITAASDALRFLTLSQVYEYDYAFEYAVRMYGDAENKTCKFPEKVFHNYFGANEVSVESAYDAYGCTRLPFVNSQYVIDSTGRAGDMFRRVLVRVDATSSSAIFPEYGLAAYCTDRQNCGDEGIVKKNYSYGINCTNSRLNNVKCDPTSTSPSPDMHED